MGFGILYQCLAIENNYYVAFIPDKQKRVNIVLNNFLLGALVKHYAQQIFVNLRKKKHLTSYIIQDTIMTSNKVNYKKRLKKST